MLYDVVSCDNDVTMGGYVRLCVVCSWTLSVCVEFVPLYLWRGTLGPYLAGTNWFYMATMAFLACVCAFVLKVLYFIHVHCVSMLWVRLWPVGVRACWFACACVRCGWCVCVYVCCQVNGTAPRRQGLHRRGVTLPLRAPYQVSLKHF